MLAALGMVVLLGGCLAGVTYAFLLSAHLRVDDNNHMDAVPPGWHVLPWVLLMLGLGIATYGARHPGPGRACLRVRRAGWTVLLMVAAAVYLVVPIEANLWNDRYRAGGGEVCECSVFPSESWF